MTVTVPETPQIKVRKLPNRPGLLRVKNPADYAIRFLWGSMREDGPDGKVRIRKHRSRVVRVRRTHIIWIAIGKKGQFIDFGRVGRIKLPPGTRPPTDSELLDLDRVERQGWARAPR